MHLISLTIILLNSLQETHDQDLASYKLQHIRSTNVSAATSESISTDSLVYGMFYQ